MQAGDKYAQLKASIQVMYECQGRYGYRRITAELVRCGQQVKHKTVQRLMNDMPLKSLVRLKNYRSYRGELSTTPNLLNRQSRPNVPMRNG